MDPKYPSSLTGARNTARSDVVTVLDSKGVLVGDGNVQINTFGSRPDQEQALGKGSPGAYWLQSS